MKSSDFYWKVFLKGQVLEHTVIYKYTYLLVYFGVFFLAYIHN